MFRTKMKVTTTLLVLGFCVGAGFWTRQQAVAEPREGKSELGGIGARFEEPKSVAVAVEMKGPAGAWERVVGPYRFVLRFEGDRLFGTCTIKEDKETVTILVEADYGVTRDSVLFGALTGLEVPGDPEAEVESSAMLDHAFSLRYRIDGDVLTIKDVKFDMVKENGNGDIKPALLIGRYKRKPAGKEEPVQEPRQRTRRNTTRAETPFGAGTAVPCSGR